MKHLAILMLVWLCTACMGSAREDAALATNTAQGVLTAVDEVWAPILQDRIAQAKALDDAQYRQHMQPYLAIHEAIESARRGSQILNLAVQTWDAQQTEGAMWREVAPCVIRELQLARALLVPHALSVPPQLMQALTLIEAALITLTPSGACKAQPPAQPQPTVVTASEGIPS